MNTQTHGAAAEDSAAEPGQTEINSNTVLAEDQLVDDGDTTAPPPASEAGVRPKIGAIPSSYGAPGGSVEPDAST